MQPATLSSSISYIGTLVQLGAGLMLVGLFVLLRRYVVRRRYFSAWTAAWIAGVLAIGAVVLRVLLLPSLGVAPLGEDSLPVRLLYVLYQAGKLAFFAFLVVGTRMYAFGGRVERLYRACVPIAMALAVVTVLLSRTMNDVVAWQALPAIAALSYCAVTLLRLPRSRQSLGSIATGYSFAAMALLWSGYLIAFGRVARGMPAAPGSALGSLVAYNSYLDMLGNILLGYGMVVLLMQDAKREVDDAHAELAVAHDELQKSALYDSLTNSLNRIAFSQGVGMELARGTFGAVVMIDLDNLKTVNDTFGHVTGDRLLRHVADHLRAGLRASDRLYRWGGDEFLLLLPGARAGDVRARFERMLASADPLSVDGSDTCITVEASVGAYDYASAEELPDAIGWADAAMYTAKVRRKSRRGAPLRLAGAQTT